MAYRHTTQLGIPAYDAARWMIAPPPVRNIHRLASGAHILVQVGSSASGCATQEAVVADRRDESLLIFPDGSSGFDLHMGQRRLQPEAEVAFALMGPEIEARWIGHPTSHRMIQLHFPPGFRRVLTKRQAVLPFEGEFLPASGALGALLSAFSTDADSAGTPLSVLDAYVLLLAEKISKTKLDGQGGLADWQVRRVCEAIEASTDESFDLSRFASLIGLSASHFSRAFKRSVGCSPSHWHQKTRLRQAMDLLRDPRLSLAEIALLTGFSAQPQFTTFFRRLTGSPPGRWRHQSMR